MLAFGLTGPDPGPNSQTGLFILRSRSRIKQTGSRIRAAVRLNYSTRSIVGPFDTW